MNGLTWSKWITAAVVSAIAGNGCLMAGCSGNKATPEDIKQRMEVAKEWAAIAKEHGLTGQMTLHWRGYGKLALEEAVSADIGVDLHAAMHFGGPNVQATSPDVP